MARPIYSAYEIVNGDNLPAYVGVCRTDQPPLISSGQSLRWLAGACIAIDKETAQRIAAARVDQIRKWAGDNAPWLCAPLPPDEFGRGHRRGIVRIWPDGRQEPFASVTAAARVVRRSRQVLVRRLRDGRTDHTGCRWVDNRNRDSAL
jgi:hypothetical protein